MDTLLLSLLIGVAAGIVVVIPMMAKNMPIKSTVSAFLQYLFISVIIVNADIPHIPWWLQGTLIALMMAVPISIIINRDERKSIPFILINSVVLGTLIGIAGHYLK